MSDPNRTPTKSDTKIDDPSSTENIDLPGSINQNTKALHSTSNEEKDDKSTNDVMVTNSELETFPNVGEGKDDEKVSPVFTKEKEVDEEKDLEKDPAIETSSPPTAEATAKQNDAPLKETNKQITVVISSFEELTEKINLTPEETKDDEKVSPVFKEEEKVSIIDEEKDLGKESEIEISSPPTAEATVKQNDAPLKETDKQTIAEEKQVSTDEEELQLRDLEKDPAKVSSPLTAEVTGKQNDAPLKEIDKQILQEKINSTPEETTPKKLKPIWAQEKGKYLNASIDERKRRRDKCTNCFEIETWPEYYNEYLNNGKEEVHAEFPEISEKVSIWKGDITSLLIDAIVNAANEKLLGGGGVDGAIHSAAGPLLKEECSIFGGRSAGESVITGAYNLPAKYVIHTVGPRGEYPDKLKDCYMSSLQLLIDENQRTIAFPCISTGIFGYPNDKAADVVLKTVRKWLDNNHEKVDRVIFCLFLDKDVKFYKEKLLKYFPMKNVHTESPEEGATENRDESEQEIINDKPSSDPIEKDCNHDLEQGEETTSLISRGEKASQSSWSCFFCCFKSKTA